MTRTDPHPVLKIARYAWALPYTFVGLAFAPFVAVTGGRVQIMRGVIEMYGRLPAFWLRHVVLVEGALAITIGHVVLARDREALELTRTHERAHVHQYERWGIAFGPAYLLASVCAIARKESAYFGNRFERDARAYARSVNTRAPRGIPAQSSHPAASSPKSSHRVSAWRMRRKVARRLRVSPRQ